MIDTTPTTTLEDVVGQEDVVLYMEQYRPWFWQVFIIVFPALPLFWKYHVKITETEISFGYSSKFTSKRANRTAIVKEAKPLFDQKWGGWGIHYRPPAAGAGQKKNLFFGSRWERLYIAKNGGAVKVTLDEAGGKGDDDTTMTTFFFSSEDPQKVCDILNKKV